MVKKIIQIADDYLTSGDRRILGSKRHPFDNSERGSGGIIRPKWGRKIYFIKDLSKITEPTLGTVRVNGRITSLLEVGTGFHPDLTGRENIFLNGAIMGMSYREMKKKFDEIVAFAEIEKFLDTPIKRYSSGMFMRLGFAIAAHLDSEILIVDEVLAVGDAQFQEKCLKKMNEIGAARTNHFICQP